MASLNKKYEHLTESWQKSDGTLKRINEENLVKGLFTKMWAKLWTTNKSTMGLAKVERHYNLNQLLITMVPNYHKLHDFELQIA